MAATGLPAKLVLEVVTPEGLLLKEEVDDVQAPGQEGYFGVLPGHTPFLTTLGAGEISYGKDGVRRHLACFWGFCEVLPDRVSVLAEIAERAEDIDLERAQAARVQSELRLKTIKDEAGYEEAHIDYIRAVTRLAVARKHRG